MSPLELVERYINRAANVRDAHSLKSLRWRGLGAIHALHASGLMSDVENDDALNLFVDTCSARHTELTGASDDSEGGAL